MVSAKQQQVAWFYTSQQSEIHVHISGVQ